MSSTRALIAEAGYGVLTCKKIYADLLKGLAKEVSSAPRYSELKTLILNDVDATMHNVNLKERLFTNQSSKVPSW